ncbi:uncharacterized protein LOC132266651 [Cornus florida]|uniref:uncharacterized protein LOC132266651 n=1 Tax=Cornus florida TaxID=4283 RepID=UPI0028A1B0C9|nr:uncharacterized protein LOC132266651 [Cornus florida]
MVKKERGRKRKEEDDSSAEWQVESGEQMSSNQDSFNCPAQISPVPSRYQTRNAKAGLGQGSTSRYSKQSPIQTQVTPNPTGTPRLAKTEKNMGNSNFASKSNTSNDEAEVESYISKVIFPEARAQPAAALSASNEAVSNNHQLLIEANEASNIVGSRPEGSANNCNQREEHQGQTSSFNLTGMAEMLDDDDSCDLNEVGSSYDSALVMVNGYRVKPELAPLLRAIFLKHGDIAKDCSLLSITTRSSLLDVISSIVQKLQATEFKLITADELTSLLEQVRDLESVKMEVGWLRQRLADISEAMQLFKGYSSLKGEHRRRIQAVEKKEEELKSFHRQIRVLQERVILAEDELIPMKAEAVKIDETVSETKAKVKSFCQKSLVHGLI